MGKFDFSDTIEDVKKSLKKSDMIKDIGTGSDLSVVSNDPADYVVMPDWWKENYGVLGLQFGRIVQIAGKPDSGKTSLCIEAMRRAQEQGYGVVYVETEGKTSPQDLEGAGIDPKGIMLVKNSITERAFDAGFLLWDKFFEKYPKDKLLFVFDSYGNTVSMRDESIQLSKDGPKVGGASKINRLGLNKIIAKLVGKKEPVAVLFVNYTYNNLGSPGRTNAGGDALNFFNMIAIQSSRKAWVKGKSNGVDVRKGAIVKWDTYKNHYAKHLLDEHGNKIYLPASLEIKITEKGMEVVGSSSSTEEDGE